MKKHINITAIVSALCCLASFLRLPAHAADLPRHNYYEGAGGMAIVEHYSTIWGFVAVTDGTALKEYDSGYTNDPINTVTRITEDKASFIASWDEDSAPQFADHAEDALYYDVRLHLGHYDNISAVSRRYMLETEGVTDVIVYNQIYSGIAFWNGELFLELQADLTPEASDDFTENFESPLIAEYTAQYEQWQQAIADWELSVADTDMTPDELAAARREAGLPTDFEMVDYAFTKAAEITAAHSDVIAYAWPGLRANAEGQHIYIGRSAWEGIGDVNADAAIDATDAAAVLAHAAETGSGNTGALNTDALQAADVNADGLTDAVDAAAILAYAARTGAGEDITIADAAR